MFFVLDLRKFKFIFLFLCIIAIALIIFLCTTPGKAIKAVNTTHCNTVYLTFDDGPSGVTEKVLEVLTNHDIKATFFIIGETNSDAASLYNRIISEGHALGLHSYTHNMGHIYSSKDNYVKDFERLRDFVAQTTGAQPKICRMVGGSYTCPKWLRTQILDYFESQGYSCYDWDIDPKDSGAYALEPKLLANNVIKAAQKKLDQDLVVLLHDDSLRKTLPDALEIIIPYFKEQGYKFDILSQDTPLYGSRALLQPN